MAATEEKEVIISETDFRRLLVYREARNMTIQGLSLFPEEAFDFAYKWAHNAAGLYRNEHCFSNFKTLYASIKAGEMKVDRREIDKKEVLPPESDHVKALEEKIEKMQEHIDKLEAEKKTSESTEMQNIATKLEFAEAELEIVRKHVAIHKRLLFTTCTRKLLQTPELSAKEWDKEEMWSDLDFLRYLLQLE